MFYKQKIGSAGISLVEISIVLTVIAILMGIVVGGISIKKASEITSIISDVKSYQTAIENFSSEYKSLPGDMNSATSYWNDTNNGNGNGLIESPQNNRGDIESFLAWQHLIKASLLKGSYTGNATNGSEAEIGVNVPSAKRSKIGYYLISGNLQGLGNRPEIRVGAFHVSSPNDYSALTPIEAKSLDDKIDDGLPLSGKVFAANGNDIRAESKLDCLEDNENAYNLKNEQVSCIMAFSAKP